jgi:hypothetical protein
MLPRNPNDWLPWKETERVSTYSTSVIVRLALHGWQLVGPRGNIGNGAPLYRDMIARTPRAASPLARLGDQYTHQSRCGKRQSKPERSPVNHVFRSDLVNPVI